MLANTPALIIFLPLEAAPRVVVDSLNDGEEKRLTDWLCEARPEYGELAARAMALAEEARAA